MIRNARLLLLCLIVLACAVNAACAQGLVFGGAGAQNRAMAGASTAAPLDAGGALYWNPAAISGLEQNEFLIGSEMLYPTIHVTSTASGGIFPPAAGTGTTRSNGGLASVPAIALVYRPDGSRWTYGFGIFSFAAGGVDFPGDANNPILAPKNPPTSFGIGPIYSNLSILQQALTASYQLTDGLAVGFGALVDYTTASFDPAFFTAPTPDGFPAATHSRAFWGGGYQAGLYYHWTEEVDLGFSFKSPQWLETFQFQSKDTAGNALSPSLTATLPRILSWGVAYKGFEQTVLACDARFLNYADTKTFGTPVSAGGLGWRDSFSLALGAQRRLTDRLAVQSGYLYNTNPIPAPNTLFNLQAPAIIQHTVSLGSTFALNDTISTSLTYIHAFRNSISGPVGELPGATVKVDSAYDSLAIAVNVKFGPPTRAE